MTRTQTACYCLLASAFILGALVFVQASKFIDNSAQANMAVNKESVTLVTAQYQGNTEILYLLDSNSQRLMAYLLDPNRGVIQLLPGGSLDIGQSFAMLGGNAGNDGAVRPGVRRRR